MTEEEYIILYEKRASGTCSENEKQRLLAYEETLSWQDNLQWKQELGDDRKVKSAILTELQKSIAMHRTKSKREMRLKLAAAVILVLAGIGVLWMIKLNGDLKVQDKVQAGLLNEEKMNVNGVAKLSFSDGTVLGLDSIQDGGKFERGNLKLVKSEGGKLTLLIDPDKNASEKAEWQTLETPNGGQYELILPDGTKVWLNASSSLSFTNQYNASERLVQLNGEAYFEVAKSTKEFKVMVHGTEVNVLGTHFNVMGYADEKETKTTLLEGKVKVLHNGVFKILKPGQQAAVSEANDEILIKEVPAAETSAWHTGNFVFQEDDIQTVMRKLARWYNIDVVFSDDITGNDFTGTITRTENIKDVLKILELTGIVQFEMDGRRIVVMK